MQPHKFWDTQPVPKMREKLEEEKGGPLEEKTLEDVSKEPLPVPKGFRWDTVDLKNDEQAQEVYDLLKGNYVEDDENMFRFDYSIDFLRWILIPHNQVPSWMIGIRAEKTGKLLAFISAIPVTMSMHEKDVKMAEINFLCVHKKLRAHRIAPVLIKEVTRRVNLKKIWQAVYTAGVKIPTPVVTARYFHRNLNYKKLVEVGFTQTKPGKSIAVQAKIFKLPTEPLVPGIRPMVKKDSKKVHELLSAYLAKSTVIYQKWTYEDVIKHLLPVEGVLHSYVVESSEGEVTDFFSFYSLPSSVLKNEKHDRLEAAYAYYFVSNEVSMQCLMKDALIIANQLGFDVFNCLDIMGNEETMLEKLQFGPGDGNLHFYLYNWR